MTALTAITAGPAARARRRRWVRPGIVLSLLVLAVALLWTVLPSLFAPGDPTAGSAGQALRPPSPEHWFGTDSLGRDLYTRVVHGAAQSVTGALIAVTVGFVVGTAIGLIAGSVRGWVDDSLMRVIDVMLAIPSLLLSLSIVILLGFGTATTAVAVGVTSIAVFARLSRSQVVSVRVSEYVEAAYGSGGTFWTVMWRHILPNSITPVVALIALQFGSAILQIATLGFLGYGAPPPTPEWGLLISEGRNYVATAWWLTVLPGIVVVFVVLATNRVSQALRGGGEG
ncbi:ABC transporter permease [Microbacterium sp. P01]|uniref:ABC transporter permease n=1 Tax=Microbacterium sp. P01 TaxID=3366261 RepID=UPI0036725A80